MRPFLLLGYAAALVGGTYLAYRPVFDSGFALVQAETGDGMLNHYLLEHSWLSLADPGYAGTLTRPPFFHPERWAWWYSETLIGAAPIYWALRTVTDDQLAYSWWMIACSALNFVSFAVVARRLGCAHAAAALGAVGFAFLAVVTEQQKHQQLIPRFWMPPAVYYAWLLGSAPSARALGRMLACLALQGVTCVYTGWFLGVGLVTFVPLAAVLTPGGLRKLLTFARTEWKPALLAAAPGVAALAAFFAPYLLVNRGYSRAYFDTLYLTPSAAGWLTPAKGTLWSGPAEAVLPVVSFECWLFPGFAAVALLVAAGWWVRREPHAPGRPLAAACLVTAVVWAVLCSRVGSTSPWALVQYVPGAGAIRCVSRVVLLVDLFAALAVAVWLTHALGRLGGRWRAAAAVAGLVVVVGAEQLGHEPPLTLRADYYPAVDLWAERLRGADAAYVVPRPGFSQEYEEVFAMWVGLRANVPVVNGYSGRHPAGFPLEYAAEVTDPDATVRDWLTGRFRGRVVVIDRADPGRRRELVIE
ncbi:hypothetical protein [Urbifossiella limnaea]|uniref:Glycosyltransferase RgtA/B/C/D-like domain-containing protein n=1 Tax=Urbifossiella limnaea TaxID=2528023 RepID=A0A517XM15_9BACT|nr:hypothetical protein [Urbifossiella limnaea]QDU18553.1 hypothetical protein ETAA1_04450 [Urbifossiella limnaea]